MSVILPAQSTFSFRWSSPSPDGYKPGSLGTGAAGRRNCGAWTPGRVSVYLREMHHLPDPWTGCNAEPSIADCHAPFFAHNPLAIGTVGMVTSNLGIRPIAAPKGALV